MAWYWLKTQRYCILKAFRSSSPIPNEGVPPVVNILLCVLWWCARCIIELSSNHGTSRSSLPALMSYAAIIKVILVQMVIFTYLFLAGITEQHSTLIVLWFCWYKGRTIASVCQKASVASGKWFRAALDRMNFYLFFFLEKYLSSLYLKVVPKPHESVGQRWSAFAHPWGQQHCLLSGSKFQTVGPAEVTEWQPHVL